MDNQHHYDRGRRDNGRRGSGYETNRNDSRNDSRNNYRDPYSGSWRSNEDRYEDDRYHSSRMGRQREEDDYGPFSHIHNNNSRREDFDTRYNDKGNYYYGNGPQNDRSDEARGKSFGDIFRGGRNRGNDDREYFTSYRSGDDNRYGRDPQYSLYGSDDSSQHNRNRYNHDDDRNFFERAGDKIRDTWNDWRHNERDNDRRDDRDYRNQNDEDRYRNMRHNSDRGNYSGNQNDSEKRRRYNEGYLY